MQISVVIDSALRIGPALVEDKTENNGNGHTSVHLRIEQKRVVEGLIAVVIEAVEVYVEQMLNPLVFKAFFQQIFIVGVNIDVVRNRQSQGSALNVVEHSIVKIIENVGAVNKVIKLKLSRLIFLHNVNNLRVYQSSGLIVRSLILIIHPVDFAVVVNDVAVFILMLFCKSFIGKIAVFIIGVVVEVAV